jgi:predicted helicase
LHAKSYRKRYLDFLRSDFPRIPFPLDESDLKTLSSLGKKLMQAHLLRTVPDYGLGSYTGTGSNVVERVRYSSNEQAIYVNDDQYFANIPVGVWGYHIGGYNVLEKYLKDRRKRKLALADVNTIAGVANVLAFTLEQTQAIEAAYVGARFK